MANVLAMHSVCSSIATFLNNTYPAATNGMTMPACDFEVLSSQEMTNAPIDGNRVSLFLYRATVNEHSRQQRPSRAPNALPAPLHLDLHILLSAWGATALDEHITMAWAMRQLHLHPLLDASSLSPEPAWDPDEVIQIVPAELSTEDIMRIWDALEPSYRLSASYIARTVRLDPDTLTEAVPVVASRYTYSAGLAS
jgi:Pvc16 N-terminal domain